MPSGVRRACRSLCAATSDDGVCSCAVALPSFYGVRDLTHGYQAGFVAGHPLIQHDLSRLGFNLSEGLPTARSGR